MGYWGIPGNPGDQVMHISRRDYIQTTARDFGLYAHTEKTPRTLSEHLACGALKSTR